ncbi:uncharacterized protein LOC8077065 [Sorghum bicolor]|uniref:uncharacterized protein LOC8077065 n=1 Tax=Sorghum bicolor TaxID=4558 RepID=UPI000B42367C|nr:uncharacterized protein LOC8077065 [Sorghum bicolor]|eukprot:XP_002467711.2 uncharacterized protein LOC8077065 [Sorghum bicolor]
MISSYLSIGLPPSNYAATWEASSSKQNSRAQPPHDHTPPPPPALVLHADATSSYTPAPISWGSLPPMSSPQSHLHAASNPCTLPSLQRRTCSDAAASPKRPTRTQIQRDPLDPAHLATAPSRIHSQSTLPSPEPSPSLDPALAGARGNLLRHAWRGLLTRQARLPPRPQGPRIRLLRLRRVRWPQRRVGGGLQGASARARHERAAAEHWPRRLAVGAAARARRWLCQGRHQFPAQGGSVWNHGDTGGHRWVHGHSGVGDSRCILDTQGGELQLLTMDHSLEENAEERERVTASGGEVGRLKVGPLWCWPGGLCLSRSIGDMDVGEFIVPIPHVKQEKVDINYEMQGSAL